MSYDLQVLANNRDALLLAEIVAWLHMFGKLHEEFLYGNHDDIDLKIPKDVRKDFPYLTELLEDGWPGKVWKDLNREVPELRAEALSIFELIKYHRTTLQTLQQDEQYRELRKTGFLKLMIDAHGRGASAEKGVLADFAQGQRKRVYLSTPLGYEVPSYITFSAIYAVRQFLYDFLESILSELKECFENKDPDSQIMNIKKWTGLRREFIRKLEQSFRITVAETRRPLNDVTLLDQTAISVAFFKTALARNLLFKTWKDPYQRKAEDQYRWRLLKIGLNSSAFLENSIRISDLLARRSLITEALNKVKDVLEVTYPIGFEVYRDENCGIFLVPDLEDLHKKALVDGAKSLESYIQDIAYTDFSDETTFALSLGDSTRNTLSFGSLVAQTITQPMPNVESLSRTWHDVRGDICPVCGLRPQGPYSLKALSRKVCDICEDRRTNRSELWLEDLSTTIWIDEVADVNGRLALVMAQFGIDEWLSGSFFNTVLAFDPISSEVAEKIGRETLNDTSYLTTLRNEIQEGLIDKADPRKFLEFPLLTKLVKTDARGLSTNPKDHTVTQFYEIRIWGSDLSLEALPVKNLDETQRPVVEAGRLTLEMIRLSPSFSRIYRVWQTTQNFWKDLVFDFRKTVGKVSPRLKIKVKPTSGTQNILAITHAYEFKLDNISLSVTYRGNGEFVTVDNLLRTASLIDSSRTFNNNESAARYIYRKLGELKIVKVEEPTGYGSPNKLLGTLEIALEEKVPLEETPYIPAIPILTEPRTFMAFVPANKALSVAKAIKEKYEEEMGKVRNRLPLKMGIVFAGGRTPLPAVLDAGRRMLKQLIPDECWTIDKVDLSSLPKEVELVLKKDENFFLPIKVPMRMGDGTTEDAWYSYWHVEKDTNSAAPSGRRRQFKGINDEDWVHVCNLRPRDEIHYIPSRFDFEFLDSAARRFEVSYENGKRRGSPHPGRPYYLEQFQDFEKLWKILSDGLSTSQIHNLIGLIEAKDMEWAMDRDKGVFEQIVQDALYNAEWRVRPNPERYKQLCQAAVDGQLADVVELYMRILKTKTAVDKMEGGNQ